MCRILIDEVFSLCVLCRTIWHLILVHELSRLQLKCLKKYVSENILRQKLAD